ncbi:hypothetical protein EG349_06390 [Chryseobacterium shandongense]|uniref:Uncharacterized protein n=2 Tax=Chryseobacterium shandongense TaxID=1493872 RepID=A0AAD0YDG3_9FLAO|nr:hypothetical protein EG349_06390 [Chryseobacterium shandongense]AZA94847.1 hypothetical protein EG353_04400 [Chryseobacterium shandongense]
MKMNKLLVFFCGLISLFGYSQSINEYKFLMQDQYNSKIYRKFESKEGDTVKIWYKIENTIENDPGVAFTEYYLQVNCNSKTYILNTSTTYWRDGTVQKVDPPSGVPKIIPISEPNSIAGITYQNHCKK